jgi:hypothetical protein
MVVRVDPTLNPADRSAYDFHSKIESIAASQGVPAKRLFRTRTAALASISYLPH